MRGRNAIRRAGLRALGLAAVVPVCAAQVPGDVLGSTAIPSGSDGLLSVFSYYGHFGCGAAALGDVDGNGVCDLAVGASEDDDGFEQAGAVYVLLLEHDGSVGAFQKLSATSGGLGPGLGTLHHFGCSLAGIGDVDGDGVPDLAAGHAAADEVWILLLKPDGSVKFRLTLPGIPGGYGAATASPGDLDGDGVVDLAVGVPGATSGSPPLVQQKGAVHVLLMNADGTVKSTQVIDDDGGGMQGKLSANAAFGFPLAGAGDLDGDGVGDLVAGDSSGFWILRMSSAGVALAATKVAPGIGGFTATGTTNFGSACAPLGDLDGNGIGDLAVGESQNALFTGRVWTLLLDHDLTVREAYPLEAAPGGALPAISTGDMFGSALARLPDVDGDGFDDLAVGARSAFARGIVSGGMVHVLFQVDGPAYEPTGCGLNPALSLDVAQGLPVVGGSVILRVDNPLGTQAPGALPFVAVSGQPDPFAPCGTPVPGLGMAGPGAPGELLISVVAGNPFALSSGSPWQGPGTPAEVPVLIPDVPALVGGTLSVQGLLFEPAASLGVAFGLTNGLTLHVGS